MLIKFTLSTNVPSISAVQFSEGAQSLNATCVAAASVFFFEEEEEEEDEDYRSQ